MSSFNWKKGIVVGIAGTATALIGISASAVGGGSCAEGETGCEGLTWETNRNGGGQEVCRRSDGWATVRTPGSTDSCGDYNPGASAKGVRNFVELNGNSCNREYCAKATVGESYNEHVLENEGVTTGAIPIMSDFADLEWFTNEMLYNIGNDVDKQQLAAYVNQQRVIESDSFVFHAMMTNTENLFPAAYAEECAQELPEAQRKLREEHRAMFNRPLERRNALLAHHQAEQGAFANVEHETIITEFAVTGQLGISVSTSEQASGEAKLEGTWSTLTGWDGGAFANVGSGSKGKPTAKDNTGSATGISGHYKRTDDGGFMIGATGTIGKLKVGGYLSTDGTVSATVGVGLATVGYSYDQLSEESSRHTGYVDGSKAIADFVPGAVMQQAARVKVGTTDLGELLENAGKFKGKVLVEITTTDVIRTGNDSYINSAESSIDQDLRAGQMTTMAIEKKGSIKPGIKYDMSTGVFMDKDGNFSGDGVNFYDNPNAAAGQVDARVDPGFQEALKASVVNQYEGGTHTTGYAGDGDFKKNGAMGEGSAIDKEMKTDSDKYKGTHQNPPPGADGKIIGQGETVEVYNNDNEGPKDEQSPGGNNANPETAKKGNTGSNSKDSDDAGTTGGCAPTCGQGSGGKTYEDEKGNSYIDNDSQYQIEPSAFQITNVYNPNAKDSNTTSGGTNTNVTKPSDPTGCAPQCSSPTSAPTNNPGDPGSPTPSPSSSWF